MSKSCRGRGCRYSLDCDNCRNSGDCEIKIFCDLCGKEITDDYYTIDSDDICPDCLDEFYKGSVNY